MNSTKGSTLPSHVKPFFHGASSNNEHKNKNNNSKNNKCKCCAFSSFSDEHIINTKEKETTRRQTGKKYIFKKRKNIKKLYKECLVVIPWRRNGLLLKRVSSAMDAASNSTKNPKRTDVDCASTSSARAVAQEKPTCPHRTVTPRPN